MEIKNYREKYRDFYTKYEDDMKRTYLDGKDLVTCNLPPELQMYSQQIDMFRKTRNLIFHNWMKTQDNQDLLIVTEDFYNKFVSFYTDMLGAIIDSRRVKKIRQIFV